MDYLLSRHPLFKSEIAVAGYEFRSNVAADQSAVDADRSMFSLLGDGLDHVVGPYACFLNPTREAIVGELWKGTPCNKAVLGYFVNFGPSDDIAQQLLKVGNSGIRFAVSAHLEPECMYLFGNRAHAIKLDVTRLSTDELAKEVKNLRRFKAKLIADRVDTYDDLEYCKTLNFDFYQGKFISRSAAKDERQIPVNRLTMMRVLAQLQDPDLPMQDLEKTITLDAALTYKLLSYVNSAAVSLPQTVSSVGHAMRLVGLQRIRTWASVLLISSVDDKPRELMNIALVRARMCERLSESTPGVQKESYFSAGLLSVIDALLDCSMEKALDKLPLIEDVKSALVKREGPIGKALTCALAYEQADWENVQFEGLSSTAVREIYMEAIAWAGKLSSGLTK